jgi:hypothetical protein
MIPDWMLERFRLGELDAEQARLVQAELTTHPELQARLGALDADSRATLARHPPELVARVVARRLADQPPARPALPWALGAVATAAVVGYLALAPRPADDEVRLKGAGPTLRLFRLGDAGPQPLADGAPVREHEVVQVAFELAGARHLVVVSADGAGAATLHYPLDGDSRAPPGMKALPRSFELDDAPAFERFFLVTSDRPLSPQLVLDAARRVGQAPDPRTAPLPVPPGASWRSVLLAKQVTP